MRHVVDIDADLQLVEVEQSSDNVVPYWLLLQAFLNSLPKLNKTDDDVEPCV